MSDVETKVADAIMAANMALHDAEEHAYAPEAFRLAINGMFDALDVKCLDDAHGAIRALRDQLDAATKRAEEAEASAKINADAYDSQRKQIAELDVRISDLRAKAAAYEGRAEAAESRVRELEKRAEEAEHRVEHREGECSARDEHIRGVEAGPSWKRDAVFGGLTPPPWQRADTAEARVRELEARPGIGERPVVVDAGVRTALRQLTEHLFGDLSQSECVARMRAALREPTDEGADRG